MWNESMGEQIGARPVSVGLRTVEVAGVLIAAGGFGYLLSIIPDGPMGGPGAIGLMFIVTGLGLIPQEECLIRTGAESSYFDPGG